MNIVPFEDNVTYDDDGSSTYSAVYTEFRTKKYLSWAPGILISSKVFTVYDMKLSLAFTVYPSGIAKNQEHVSVYLRNCNEGTVYIHIHASLDFLGEKHDIRQCITSGLVGFVSPGFKISTSAKIVLCLLLCFSSPCYHLLSIFSFNQYNPKVPQHWRRREN